MNFLKDKNDLIAKMTVDEAIEHDLKIFLAVKSHNMQTLGNDGVESLVIRYRLDDYYQYFMLHNNKSVYNIFSFVLSKRLHYKKDYDILELKAGTFAIVFYNLTIFFCK